MSRGCAFNNTHLLVVLIETEDAKPVSESGGQCQVHNESRDAGCIDLNSEELFTFQMCFYFPQLSAYHDLSSGILNPVISSCPSWCLSPVVGVISGLWK